MPEHFRSPFSNRAAKTAPTLIASSSHVFPRPDDWPEHVYNTGYWFLDDEPGWSPPKGLLDFLQAGSPPVYVGFGSLGDAAAADQTTALVIEALKRAGQRGVLATGWTPDCGKCQRIDRCGYRLGGS